MKAYNSKLKSYKAIIESNEIGQINAGPVYLKDSVDKLIGALHRECIRHKLQAEELRLFFWHEQRKWWESEDRSDNKPLFDYGEKELMTRKRIFNLTRKLKKAKEYR